MFNLWCGGWDSNPRRPSPADLEAGVPVFSIRINGIGHMLDERRGRFVNLMVAAYLRNVLLQQLQ
ncbi:MAG: hypothetical protein RXQ95_08195 [Vulcanisaeta sp.]